jgi:hypothetical protein
MLLAQDLVASPDILRSFINQRRSDEVGCSYPDMLKCLDSMEVKNTVNNLLPFYLLPFSRSFCHLFLTNTETCIIPFLSPNLRSSHISYHVHSRPIHPNIHPSLSYLRQPPLTPLPRPLSCLIPPRPRAKPPSASPISQVSTTASPRSPPYESLISAWQIQSMQLKSRFLITVLDSTGEAISDTGFESLQRAI